MAVVANLGVIEAQFNWITMTVSMRRRHIALIHAASVIGVVVATLIIMIAYIKVYLIVRRQVRSIPTEVLGSFGSRTIFGSSVRAAKNLLVMCAVYYLAYLPMMLRMLLKNGGFPPPDEVQFAMTCTYMSSAALNGLLYIGLHSNVRRELGRYLARCRRRSSVAPSVTRPIGGLDVVLSRRPT